MAMKAENRRLKFKRRLAQAQKLVRKHVKPGVSLSGELIAERRAEFTKERD